MKHSVAVRVGGVVIGGGNPVVIQSMTNTVTADVTATTKQIVELAAAGAELVRVAVNDEAAARAIGEIGERLKDQGVSIPLIGDFHYNGHILLRKDPHAARVLSKYRINPGNVGVGKHKDENFRTMIQLAMENERPVRIGVNWGSLDKELLAELMEENAHCPEPKTKIDIACEAIILSALRSAAAAEEIGLSRDQIVLSAKVSRPRQLWNMYEQLATRSGYALHLGLTEAGLGIRGVVESVAALAPLLARGIGDTIRVSLTPEPGMSRCLEVDVCKWLLQSLGLRMFEPSITACPGCGRTDSSLFQKLAFETQRRLKEKISIWRQIYPGVENLKVAVMGCVVNGPGESKHADVGISLPGRTEEPKAPVYVDGKLHTTLAGDSLIEAFCCLLEEYVARRFGDKCPKA
ncbi:MAG: flavodoxin-dependent (E)-4-hydroxy-3-methylbut-2-enyl-diphosphate synthase [Pseudomonadota bacterium]